MQIKSSIFPHQWLSSLLTLLCLSLLPLPASAFDASGGIASIFIILGLGGFTLLNLFLQGLFFWAGKYRSKRFTYGHVLSASLIPIISLVLALYDHRGWSDFALNFGIICVGTGLILLPLQLNKIDKVTNRNADWILSIGALILFLLSYLIPPLCFFTLVVAHICLASTPSKMPKLLSYLGLALGYTLLIYWLYQTVIMPQH